MRDTVIGQTSTQTDGEKKKITWHSSFWNIEGAYLSRMCKRGKESTQIFDSWEQNFKSIRLMETLSPTN